MNKLLSIFSILCVAASAAEIVTYESFGAKGDGKQNDGPAIAKAHAYANERRLPVKADDRRIYYIGKMDSPAVIQTDTDWGKAHFIIDDRNIFSERQKAVFTVSPTQSSFEIKPPASLKRGAVSIGVATGVPALVKIENSNVRKFIRKGLNQNSGVPQQEVLLVDCEGKIDPATPLLWDYDAVTKMSVFPLDEKELILRGGNFTTIANAEPSKYTYFQRNIQIRRSNVKLSGIRHRVEKEGKTGAPYSSFVSVSQCAYVTIEDSVFSGHKTYVTIGSAGEPVPMGSYDLNASHACFVTWRNCKQFNSIHDSRFWGILGTNYCRRLCLEKCEFSRFDAHQGAADVILKECKIGHQGIKAIGFGTLLVENCDVTAWSFIGLRLDYGSFWRGKFIIRNSTLHAKNGMLITGSNDGMHDFGYLCMMPEEVIVENFHFDNAGEKNPAYIFAGFGEQLPREKYPYQAVKKCILHRVTAGNGKKIQLSDVPSRFSSCIVTNHK